MIARSAEAKKGALLRYVAGSGRRFSKLEVLLSTLQ
jgi:hypothetical protein